MQEGVLILDGAMGTMIQAASLQEADYRGERFAAVTQAQSGNNELLCLSRPHLIRDIHRAYLQAGADIVSTNSFNANKISLEDYGMSCLAYELNVAAARLAREACDAFMQAQPQRRCAVAGSIGPGNKSASMSPRVEDPGYRAVNFAQLTEAYTEQVRGLLDGGVDILLLETVFDTLNAKAALFAIAEVLQQRGLWGAAPKMADAPWQPKAEGLCFPVMLSATIDASGRVLSGQSIEALVASVGHFPLWSLGLNCSFGADKMAPFIRQLARIAPCLVSAHPNAGLPDAFGQYAETPELMAQKLRPYIAEGYVNILGGCCGTRPPHIQAMSALRDSLLCQSSYSSRPIPSSPSSQSSACPVFSGLDVLELREPIRFALVGERCNVAGSKKFARLIREEKYEEALDVAREMVAAGAHIIDINMDDPLLDAPAAMTRFLQLLAAEPEISRLPVMLDSSRWEVLEAGLACLQGKGLVNSISLKEGEAVFLERAAKIRQYGAAMVVMAFDEQGQATTLERRTAICSRAYALLTEKLGIAPRDIIFDPNVLTIGTGMEEHRGFAMDFIDTVRFIKQQLPGALVSGGVSNLSFAFRGNNTLREAMHSVFLYHAIAAGLDMAIVNPAAMLPYEQLPEALRVAVEDVVLNSDEEATTRLLAIATGLQEVAVGGTGLTEALATGESVTGSLAADKTLADRTEEPVGKRLTQALMRGDTRFLEADLQEAIAAGYSAISLIEGPLMDGMRQLGLLFGEGKMFLPQVVKSARVMKQAVGILQPWLQDTASEGKPRQRGVIATVKGDVHDIGKNIAAVVMECNHYELIDLGVMVPALEIVEAALKHKADFVGLSGLITPSLDEMCLVAEAMETAGLRIPLLLGGATTSKEYTALRMASKYSGLLLHCPDASSNVGYLARWFSPTQREGLMQEKQIEYQKIIEAARCKKSSELSLEEARSRKARLSFENLAVPAFLGLRQESPSIAALRPLISWSALYRLWEVDKKGCSCGCTPAAQSQEGTSGQQEEALSRQQLALRQDAEALLDSFETGVWGAVGTLVGIFPACSNGAERISVFARPNDATAAWHLDLPRQQKPQPPGASQLCLADFVAPASGSGLPSDSASAVSAASAGDYIGLFAVNAQPEGARAQMAVWTAEGDSYRALLLQSLCDRLAEAASVWLHQRVQTEWWGRGAGKGIRPAIAYPACPDHSLKRGLLTLLEAESRLGLHLTEHCMLQPVSSVCGLYFSHPQACYFSV